MNLREQHDALEFLSSLVDSLDEAVKSLNKSPILVKVMGGSFADQKICKDCPHRGVCFGLVCEFLIVYLFCYLCYDWNVIIHLTGIPEKSRSPF